LLQIKLLNATETVKNPKIFKTCCT